jgi:hypothetical protein
MAVMLIQSTKIYREYGHIMKSISADNGTKFSEDGVCLAVPLIFIAHTPVF